MANSPRLRGSNVLLDVDTYNSCFASYFGVSVVDVLGMVKHCDLQLLYYYGLRRVCGLSVRSASVLLGYPNSFTISFGLKWCCKKLCLFDDDYSLEFAESWASFRKYCRLFRVPLSGAERSRRWRQKHSNKKKRKKS